MSDNEIRVNWLDFFRFVWSKKLLIVLVLGFTLLLSFLTTSHLQRNFTVKIPYTIQFIFNPADVVNVTNGKWRSKMATDKNLIDSNIEGILIHHTDSPDGLNEYLDELKQVSSEIGKIVRNKKARNLDIILSYPVEISSSDSNAREIRDIGIFLQNYDSGVKNAFKAYHPDMFPFMGRKIGIIKDKNKRISKIIFNLFIVSFFLGLYIFISYLRRNS